MTEAPLIDLAHAPFADEGGDVVMGEAVTDGQDHSCRSVPDSAPILVK